MSLDELAGPEVGDISFPYGHNVAHPSAAELLRLKIFTELEGTTVACFALEQSWVRLGVLLSEFKQQEHWRSLGYQTFDDFISELKSKFNRGRTVLYGYLAVAEVLLPTMSADVLEKMGISKALELKRAMKKLDGKPLPAGLLEAALDPSKTTTELRGAIGSALHITEEPKGTWLDLQGFFMLPDERKEFKEAFLATEGLLGLSNSLPDHIRRKCVIIAWMQEFYGTHAAEFNGVQQPVNTAPMLLMQKVQTAVDDARDCSTRFINTPPCSCGGDTNCKVCF